MKTINNITVIGTGNVALQFSKLFLKNKFKIDGIYGRSNFSDSQIILDKKLINFICKRIARSYDKISEFICTIDKISLKKKNRLI